MGRSVYRLSVAWRSVALIVVALMLGACSTTNQPLYVSAASSLSGAFGEIESTFETRHPGVDVVVNLGGSSTLGYQILEGAPIDVFASADGDVMNEVASAGWLTSTPVGFAANRLQIVVPSGNPGGVESLASFADTELLLGACAASVPCGQLAEMVLAEAGVEAEFDSRETSVKAVLSKVAQGELDAGLVYVTDIDPHVEVLPIESSIVNTYPLATITDRPEAGQFVEFVLSEAGSEILGRWGFARP